MKIKHWKALDGHLLVEVTKTKKHAYREGEVEPLEGRVQGIGSHVNQYLGTDGAWHDFAQQITVGDNVVFSSGSQDTISIKGKQFVICSRYNIGLVHSVEDK